MSLLLTAQLIGFFGVVFSILVYQFNKRSTILRLGTIAALLYSLHFLLLGAYTGSAMNLIGGVRGYVFYKIKPDNRHRWILYVFIALAALSTLLTWNGLISLLPFTATSIGGFALWHQDPKYIRRWILLAPPIWFVYSYLVGSYPGMLIEIIVFTSNIIGEIRFDVDRKKHMQKKLVRPA